MSKGNDILMIRDVQLAFSLQMWLVSRGVEAPDNHYLNMTTGEVDTDKQELTIGYEFLPLPDDEEEDD